MPKYRSKIPTNRMRIKTAFVSAVLRETAIRIREDQNRVVDEWDLFESGALKSSLQGNFSVGAEGDGGNLRMRYLTYFRFLDMPDPRRKSRRLKREGYHAYNQIVFGNLYSYGLPELQYGFTKEIHDKMVGEIDLAMSGMNKYQRAEMMLTDIADKDRFMAAILSKSMRQGY